MHNVPGRYVSRINPDMPEIENLKLNVGKQEFCSKDKSYIPYSMQ